MPGIFSPNSAVSVAIITLIMNGDREAGDTMSLASVPQPGSTLRSYALNQQYPA